LADVPSGNIGIFIFPGLSADLSRQVQGIAKEAAIGSNYDSIARLRFLLQKANQHLESPDVMRRDKWAGICLALGNRRWRRHQCDGRSLLPVAPWASKRCHCCHCCCAL